MRRPVSIVLLVVLAMGGGTAAMAGTAERDQANAARPQDSSEPAQPTGFERRDMEEMDRRAEKRREQRRVEDAARARAEKERKQAVQPVSPPPGDPPR